MRKDIPESKYCKIPYLSSCCELCQDDFSALMTPIELIGYSKNNIIEAERQLKDEPVECIQALKVAYGLLNDVQSYLFYG